MRISIGSLLVLFAFIFAAPTVGAQTFACGTYVDADSEARLEVLDNARARLLRDSIAPKSLRYRRHDRQLTLYDVDDGYADRYTLSADGRTLTGEPSAFQNVFVLADARECAMVKRAPPGVCESDLDVCFVSVSHADEVTLESYCKEDLPFACVALIEHFQRKAQEEKETSAPVEAPPECREGTPTFSAADCETMFARIMMELLGTSVRTFYSDDTPLQNANLERLGPLCERSASAKLCGAAAEKLWTGARYIDARKALQRACDVGGDDDACRRVAPLATVAPSDFEIVAMTTLPCGRYVAETGLMSEYLFGDRGAVAGGLGASMRARLENGDVRIRHDKGGDFVLRRLADGRLIGIETWNRYALYRRADGAETCAPPVTYRETALVEDCPQPGPTTPEACCASGRLHGCNIVGHGLALQNRWYDAAPQYLKVCAGGVRIGCENLVRVFAETGDDTIPESLAALCATDQRHVACDVAETTNWATLSIAKILEALSDEKTEKTDAPDESKTEAGAD